MKILKKNAPEKDARTKQKDGKSVELAEKLA
jgi:hypothetical protein